MSKKFEWSISSLAGARLDIIKKLEKEHSIESEFKSKWKKSKLVSGVMSTLAHFDELRFKKLEQNLEPSPPPIFIIGHWRSGTTLLHNLLCKSIKNPAYCTTYQNVFPNNLFAFYNIIQPAVQFFMPKERPADNVEMHTLFPQEEEFAIGNEIPFSFYYWMFFPKDMLSLSDKYLTGKTATLNEVNLWKENYKRFVKRCILKTGGKQFISKNPPNTARIPWLLDIYPNAKFIYIKRNTEDVLNSTNRFFNGVLPAQQHQKIQKDALKEQINIIYNQLIDKYEKDKSLIPQGNLIEIKFEDLVNSPSRITEEITNKLNIN